MITVYKETNYRGRVNLAASYIAAKRPSTRTFDTCFEMHDGDAVVTALIRRADANPGGRLAANLFTYIGRDQALKTAKNLANVPTRELPTIAANLRRRAKDQFDAWMKSQGLASSQTRTTGD